MTPENTIRRYGLVFHHLGLAARHPAKASAFLDGLGYEVGKPVRDDRQNVNLIMCRHASMPDVEIVYPTETAGPVDRLLASGEALVYHFCFETDDLPESLRRIENDCGRADCIFRPRKSVLFGERRVSFYLVPGFGVIELLEK